MSKELTWNEEFGTGGKLDCICDQCKKKVTYKFSKKFNLKNICKVDKKTRKITQKVLKELRREL